MEMNFGHSLFGYDPAHVRNKIDMITKDYERTLWQLEDELARLNQEIIELKDKVEELETELVEYHELNSEISKVLVNAHMEATQKVFEATLKAEDIYNKAKERVMKKERESAELKDTVKKLTGEMQSIARDYNSALEAFRDG